VTNLGLFSWIFFALGRNHVFQVKIWRNLSQKNKINKKQKLLTSQNPKPHVLKFKERPLLATIFNARLLFSTANIPRIYFLAGLTIG
jgi:hypothetical protein